MPQVQSLTRSLVGQKILMALTGVVLLLFVIGHMIGNLKVFLGPEHFNAYAEGLRTVGAPFFGRGQVLWLVRLVLIVAVGLHIWSALVVTMASWRARPVGYRTLALVETTFAARTIRLLAICFFLYIVFHLLDLTFGRTNPAFVPGDAYHNLVASFQRFPVALVYEIAMVILGLHLYHGIWSACQTLGFNHPRYNAYRRGAALLIAVVTSVGFAVVPLAVQAGIVR